MADAIDATTWHADADGDTYGDPAVTEVACDPPAGFVADGTDCDDSDSSVSPATAEVCDGADNNCDGTVDEEVTTLFYPDNDSDGFGDHQGINKQNGKGVDIN